MKKTILISAMLIAMIYACNSESKPENKATTEQTSSHEIYQCPMKCEGDKTYDKQGQCPACGMDLKKTEAHTHEEHQH